MKVTFRETGGVAGLTRGIELDTSSLPPADAKHLEQLVLALRDRPRRTLDTSNARDLTNYDITIHDAGVTHHLSFNDMTLSEDAQPLINLLQRQSRPVNPK